MEATALICDKDQQFSLESVRLKAPAHDQITIRTHFSGVSIGTEFALIRNKISWGPYPLCTGYMGAGIVEGVGSSIADFAIGDRVYFRGNDGMRLLGGTDVSCVSGTHCSHVVRRPHTTHGVGHVPDEAGMDVASMFVMPAVGLFGVDMANPRMGQTVVVYGTGLIGLGVVATCAQRGCVVIAVDIAETQLGIAQHMGADYLVNANAQDVEKEVKKIAPNGADVVLECTGLPECIDKAILLCRPEVCFVWQGNYGEEPVPMHFLAPHGRRLRMFFPCDDGYQPCRRAVLKNMAMGALRWEHCITHRISHTEAPSMFEAINTNQASGVVGVVIDWSSA